MKVGFFIGNAGSTGGTERLLQSVANGLAGRGYQIVVISMWGSGKPAFRLDERIKRYRLRKEYPKGVRAHLENIAGLYRILKREQIGVLIDVDLILTLYSLPVKFFIPNLYRISWKQFNYRYQFAKNSRIRKIAMWLSAKFSDVVVVLSKEDKAYYKKKYKFSGRLCQIYNPNPYHNVSCGKAKEKFIFAAGRLIKSKGFDCLLQSWELLEKDFPDWELCIAGEGEEKERLLEEIKERKLQKVELPGYVSDMEHYYEKCALFVLPSRNEGFGMVLVEAMAYGSPVVSFACESGPKEIITDGKDGFLVPTGDYREFAAKMRCLMESEELREKMGRYAQKSIERFDIENILRQWEKLLDLAK